MPDQMEEAFAVEWEIVIPHAGRTPAPTTTLEGSVPPQHLLEERERA